MCDVTADAADQRSVNGKKGGDMNCEPRNHRILGAGWF